jgi:hypothetical protein
MNIRIPWFPGQCFLWARLDMAKTRRISKSKRAKKSRKVRRGGGPSCYKTDKNGTIIRTWSCTTECGENGGCEPIS